MQSGSRRRRNAARPRANGRLQRGQSLVEFSLVLMPMFIVMLGIFQFGLIFNAYVTLTNAAREGARMGTIYIYDQNQSKSFNDTARNDAIKTAVTASMNLLSKTAPQFTVGGTWTSSGTTYTNGDLVVTYTIPAGISDSDPRTGQQVTVAANYHQDLVVPLISNLLPRDMNGRLGLAGAVTMVIN
jgi:Flp pilus assembly protein TadG